MLAGYEHALKEKGSRVSDEELFTAVCCEGLVVKVWRRSRQLSAGLDQLHVFP